MWDGQAPAFVEAAPAHRNRNRAGEPRRRLARRPDPVEFALSRPEAVEAIVTVGAGLRDTDWSKEIVRFGESEDELLEAGDVDGAVELNLRTWVDGQSRGPDEVDRRVRARVAEMQRRAFEVQLEALARDPKPGPERPFDPPASTSLDEIRCPALVLAGAVDQPDILRVADQLGRGIPARARFPER
jgi:3-oxoadipate enol-lactonase